MTQMKSFAFSILLCALALGCGKDDKASTDEAKPSAEEPAKGSEQGKAADENKPSDEAPAKPDLEGWATQTSKDGGYSVMAPALGEPQFSSTGTPAGPAKTATVMHMKEGYMGALMVMYMDMPVKEGTPLDIERGLEDGRDRAVGAYNGKLTLDERIEIDGYPGREFEFDATMPGLGDVHMIMRGAFRGTRVYMVGAVAKKGDSVHEKKGEAFVHSFKILAAAAKPQ